MQEVDAKRIEKFLQTRGTYAQRVIKVLAKNHTFMEAIESPLGEQLLQDCLALMEEKLDKIINEEATDVDRADYRSLKSIIQRWTTRIKQYNKMALEVNKSTL